jgi:PKD repeat protein
MRARSRHLAIGLLVCVSPLLGAAAPARASTPRAVTPPAATPVDARVTAPYVMQGRIVTAVRVRGEHRGQAITRHWTFAGQACTGSVCQQLSLLRERSARHYDRLVLDRVGVGLYAGSGRFYAGLVCRGRRWPRGEVVPYRITVQVTQAVPIEGIAFASAVSATYTNLRRTDRTICPIGPSHDAAWYTGVAAPLPGPPAATFTTVMNGATDTATFADTSALGAGGAPIVSRQWNFGDPASGSADTASTARATHTFSAPGAYAVSLTVTDANGLSSALTQSVVAPGPPTATFTDSPISPGASTYAFADGSTPGVGGAPIVSRVWDFGDPASGPANQSTLPNPQHTFATAGIHQVCLIVTDANGRHAGVCAAVTAPAPPTPG